MWLKKDTKIEKKSNLIEILIFDNLDVNLQHFGQ